MLVKKILQGVIYGAPAIILWVAAYMAMVDISTLMMLVAVWAMFEEPFNIAAEVSRFDLQVYFWGLMLAILFMDAAILYIASKMNDALYGFIDRKFPRLKIRIKRRRIAS